MIILTRDGIPRVRARVDVVELPVERVSQIHRPSCSRRATSSLDVLVYNYIWMRGDNVPLSRGWLRTYWTAESCSLVRRACGTGLLFCFMSDATSLLLTVKYWFVLHQILYIDYIMFFRSACHLIFFLPCQTKSTK